MYDIQALKANVKKCDTNIETFEKAIRQEMEKQQELKRMIRILEQEQV